MPDQENEALRDQFATAAMQTLLARVSIPEETLLNGPVSAYIDIFLSISGIAYDMADAMLTQRPMPRPRGMP